MSQRRDEVFAKIRSAKFRLLINSHERNRLVESIRYHSEAMQILLTICNNMIEQLSLVDNEHDRKRVLNKRQEFVNKLRHEQECVRECAVSLERFQRDDKHIRARIRALYRTLYSRK